jgi:spore coat protein H
MRTALFFWFCLSFLNQGASQLPDWGNVFPQDEVTKIKIYIHPDSLALLLSPDVLGNGHEFPATFVFESNVLSDSLINVGFRSRGNTSLQAGKKSFKIDFDMPGGVGKWQGLRELNLNGNHNDPSLLRAKMYWDICRHFGLPGSRVSYTELFVNEEYKGLYINVESVDDLFTELYFNEKTGNLWKCLYPATLEFLGTNGADYQVMTSWGTPIYDLENNTQLNDYQDLADFVNVLNNTSNQSIVCELRKVMNVDRLLQYMAIDVMTGNWDGAHFNKNNFYLFQNDLTHRLEFIPYDTDNTFGIDWFNINWSTRNIYNWDGSANLPLYNKMMAIPTFRAIYSYYIQEVANYMSSQEFTNGVIGLQSMITPSALADTYRTLDYDFTEDDFLNALDSTWGNHVTMGIWEYTQARASSALSQLDANVTSPSLVYQVYSQVEQDTAHLYFRSTMNTANVAYRIQGASTWNVLSAQITGQTAWDYGMRVALPLAGFQGTIEWQITPGSEVLVSQPCQIFVSHCGLNHLGYYVNEVAPSGTAGFSDELGEQNDWIEIYREPGSAFLWNDLWITDDPNDPNKWKLKNFGMQTPNFLTLWADDSPEQGQKHLNFKLNNTDEFVGLSIWDNGDFHWIDSITYSNGPLLYSFARSEDGGQPWNWTLAPTPSASNLVTSILEFNKSPMLLYPNPAVDEVHWSGGPAVVYDAQGRVIQALTTNGHFTVRDWPNGWYCVAHEKGRERLVIFH